MLPLVTNTTTTSTTAGACASSEATNIVLPMVISWSMLTLHKFHGVGRNDKQITSLYRPQNYGKQNGCLLLYKTEYRQLSQQYKLQR